MFGDDMLKCAKVDFYVIYFFKKKKNVYVFVDEVFFVMSTVTKELDTFFLYRTYYSSCRSVVLWTTPVEKPRLPYTAQA